MTAHKPVHTPVDYARHIALTVQLSRNALVQTLGLTMVSAMGLSCTPWPYVLGWTLLAAAVIAVENGLLQGLTDDRPEYGRTGRWAPVLRFTVTSLYALAALVLMARGGPGVRLFSISLISASVVHVLMRHYRSPKVLIACLSPYIAVIAFIGVGLAGAAWSSGNRLAALAPVFTIAMLAVQFWAARAQLDGAWTELMAARQAAEAREHAAEAANRAKSLFLANMSHELRTPLNGVLGMAQALTGDRLTKSQQERVAIIRRSSESLLTVLNDLLDLSKIEASSLALEPVEFDLAALMQGVEAAYAPLAAKKALRFSIDFAEGARGRYRGDSARLRRILYSLVDNAVKFTDAGAVTVRVDAHAGGLSFRVADSGVGITPADLKHLFEDFFQADASLTRRHGGVGLGLAVSRELATLMGGTIEAASDGAGSVFTLQLPLESLADAEAVRAPAKAEDSGPFAPLRVLAAEDNETNQLVLKALLGAAGIEPTLVDNGALALTAWEEQAWDVVLMDIQMPQMDGVEATRRIRRREGETGRTRTPILAVTANAMTHQINAYLEAGMDGVVPKPIDIQSLLAAIESVLGADPDVTPAEAVPA
jgi:signal transduction histidine kinase/ActR/RegA family two-component response regulator